jgi:hypothetical protein
MVIIEGDRSDSESCWSWICEIDFFSRSASCLIVTEWSKEKTVVPDGKRRLYPSVVSILMERDEPGYETMDPEV